MIFGTDSGNVEDGYAVSATDCDEREKPFLPCKSLNGPDEAFGGEGLLQDGSLDWSSPGAFCRHLITRESCLQGAGYSQAFSSLLGLTSETWQKVLCHPH